MQNPIPKLFPRNQAFYLKNWKLWRAPTTIEVYIFCWNFAHILYLVMSAKACVVFFFILFRSCVINKSVKDECVETSSFWIFANSSRLKKSHTPFCRHWKVGNVCKVSAKKINCRVVGARQSIQIFRQNTWFLENNRALSKLLYGIWNYLISIIKL